MRSEINVQFSQRAADLIDAKPKACWRNAILAQHHFSQAIYIEGWIVIPEGVVMEHGWLTLDNKIIEPTFASRLKRGSESSKYFPGAHYTLEEAIDELAKSEGELPLVYNDGRWGHETPEYMLASCDAWEYAFTLKHVDAAPQFIDQIKAMREMYQRRL